MSPRPPRRAARREQQERAAARLAAVRRAGWVPQPPPGVPGVEVVRSERDDVLAALRAGSDGTADPGDDLTRRGRHRQTPRPGTPRDGWRERLADRLPLTLRGSRWSVPLTAAAAFVALTSVVALALAVRTAAAAPGVPVPARIAAASATSATAGSPGSSAVPSVGAQSQAGTWTAASALPGAAGGGVVVVHVVGQVANPGLVRLPMGSRVHDAVAGAGGGTAEADLARVNLARPLVDGEQIVVPRPGEVVAAAVGPVAGGSGAGGPTAPPGPVDLNAASIADLDALPGIGPVLAQRIVDFRDANGRFTSVDELSEVSGIGDKLLENLRPLVTA